jgi:hypothetical protein
VTERDDGVLKLRPVVPVPTAQAWFWHADWQRREAAVDVHIREGDVAVFVDEKALLQHLDQLDAATDASPVER